LRLVLFIGKPVQSIPENVKAIFHKIQRTFNFFTIPRKSKDVDKSRKFNTNFNRNASKLKEITPYHIDIQVNVLPVNGTFT
jgi:hypothetical protein